MYHNQLISFVSPLYILAIFILLGHVNAVTIPSIIYFLLFIFPDSPNYITLWIFFLKDDFLFVF